MRDLIRKFAPSQSKEIGKQIFDKLGKKVITPRGSTEWLWNVALARKKDGTLRLCRAGDHKNLNDQTETDPYTLTKINDCS